MINLKPILLLSAVLIYSTYSIAQNVGIGTEKPHPKARLDISDSSRGVLIPRLTAKQRRAIENPPVGLILYQLDDSSGIWYFEKSWKLVAPVNGNPLTPVTGNWSLTGNSGLDSVDNFMGTTDSGRVNFRSNNIERLRIEANGDLKFNKYKNNTALDSVLTTDSSGKLLMSVSNGANSITFDSITNLYKYTGLRTLAFVKDSVVGGFFYRYNGQSPVDSGVVITDTLNRKWHRYITNNYVDVRWWGAKAADINFDNRPAFLSALKFATAIPLDPAQTYPHFWAGRVYIPSSDKYYYCSDSILITKTVEIFGDGIYSKPRFAANKTGFYIDTGCSLTRIRDLAISAYGTISPIITAHGISIKCNVRLDNVTVTGFSGNGFNIEAGAPFGSSNANNSIFFNCHALLNNEHGYYIKGADANNMVFYSCEAVANNRWGVNDQCFLGNHYYNFHAASNGSPELQYQRTVAKNPSNNHFYAAIQDGLLPEPGVAPNWQNYWYDMGTGLFTGYNIDYSASKFYETGGAYNLDGYNVSGENQTGSLLGCYSESDQGPSYFGQNVLVLGGDHGAGIRKGPFLYGGQNQLKTPNDVVSYDRTTPLHQSFMNSVGLGNLKSTTEGAVFAFDTLYNVGTVRPYSGYQLSSANGTSFGMATTLASHWGRPINDMNSALIAPKLFVVNKDNATAHLIQPAWSKPATTTNYIGGDLYLNAPYYYGSEKNDVLGWRVSPGYNDMKWTTLKVDNEINFTTTDATNNYLEFHTAIPTLFRYIIDITCSDNSGHYWTEHRIITIGINGGLPFIKDDQYENRIHDTQLNTASVDVICDNASNLITLKASGIAATNLNWKLQIKRINL